MLLLLRILYVQAKGPEIPVEGETGHVAEDLRYHDKGYRIAEREPFVPGKPHEHVLGCQPHGVIICENGKSWFHGGQEFDRCFVTCPVPEKGDCFTYDIPCGVEGNLLVPAPCEEFTGFFEVGVVRI